MQPLERQWTILRILAARRFGATVRELSDEFGVSQKTIRRDLILLENLGFPVGPQKGTHGRNHWVAAWDQDTPPLTFDFCEILALYLGRSLLEPLAGTVIWDSAQSAFRRIKASLKEPALEYLGQLSALIHRTSFHNSDYRLKAELLDDLVVAIEDRLITHITYQSARSTEPVTYEVYPYGLIWHRGSLYLVAYSRDHDELRNFKLNRTSAVALESLKFQKSADFKLEDYLTGSLGVFHSNGPLRNVRIRFSPEVARYVQEHHWHHSQILTPQKDGSLLAEFQLASFEEVKSWVQSFGPNALVLEPEELRDEIVQELEKNLAAYGVEGRK